MTKKSKNAPEKQSEDKNPVKEKIVKLGKDRYLVFLKEVAVKLGKGGKPEKTMIKAFIKKIKD